MSLITVIFIWLGLILLGLIFALSVLFVFCLSVETIIYVSRKALGLKPLARYYSSYEKGNATNNKDCQINFTNHIKQFISYFLLFFCPVKCPPDIFKVVKRCKEQTNNRGQQKPNNYSPTIVNKKFPDNSQHSNANVSQGENACQPKGNDTLGKFALTKCPKNGINILSLGWANQ